MVVVFFFFIRQTNLLEWENTSEEAIPISRLWMFLCSMIGQFNYVSIHSITFMQNLVPWALLLALERWNEWAKSSKYNGKDRHMNTLQYNMNRELIKVQVRWWQSPEKGMIHFDWEERWHLNESERKRVCQMESKQVKVNSMGKAKYKEAMPCLPIFGSWVPGWILGNKFAETVWGPDCHGSYVWWQQIWTGFIQRDK